MKALMEKLGINKDQVKAQVRTTSKGKDTGDSPKQKQVRDQMNLTYKGYCSLISASYLEAIFKRDKDNKFLLNKDNEKVVEHYTTKNLIGDYLIEDNGDGTHTATKFNVYKDTYQIDSETLNITEVSS